MPTPKPTQAEAVSPGLIAAEHRINVETDNRERTLDEQVAALRERLDMLSEATLRISEILDPDEVLQHLIDSSRVLTRAQFGVVLTYGDKGTVESVHASGLTPEEIEKLGQQPLVYGPLQYSEEVCEPIRIADISQRAESFGFPFDKPSINGFLGMQIFTRGAHIGSIFLAHKMDGEEFTSEDEESVVMLASQTAREIHNARRYEEVERTRADLQTLLDVSPVGIVSFELEEGRLLSYNEEIVRLFEDRNTIEAPWEEVLPLVSFLRFDGREIPPAEWPMTRVYQFGETIRAEEIIIQMPDGRPVPVLVNGVPIYSERGEITRAVFTLQDMRSLVDAERARAEFLGLVSEELRMPLTSIKGSVAALWGLDSISGRSEPQQLLRIIDQQADLMRGQVNSLVELTQISVGALLLSQETVEVAALLNKAITEYRAGHGSTTVELEVSDDLPLVTADSQRIVQVVNNLLVSVSKNATDLSHVKVTASVIDIFVAVSISGIGSRLPSAEKSNMESSQQLLRAILGSQAQEVRRVAGGDTLVLAMCRGIVEAHGGRLRVENDDHLGNITIAFTIPAADDEAVEAVPATTSQKRIGSTAEGEAARILLAIEEPRTMTDVRRAISAEGYVPVYTGGSVNFDRHFGPEVPDLVLLDLQPNDGAGYQTMQRISRELGVPTIVLSAPGEQDNISRAFEMGADDYIVKPFSPTELTARIKSVLRKRAASSRGPDALNVYALGGVC